jgi:hypothetical protein
MFQFPRFPPHALCVQAWVPQHYSRRVSPFGHPRLITLACSSPRLIAAGHVLLRLPAPRHPPCALSSLTFSPDNVHTLTLILRALACEAIQALEMTGLEPSSCVLCGCQRAPPYPLARDVPSKPIRRAKLSYTPTRGNHFPAAG